MMCLSASVFHQRFIFGDRSNAPLVKRGFSSKKWLSVMSQTFSKLGDGNDIHRCPTGSRFKSRAFHSIFVTCENVFFSIA